MGTSLEIESYLAVCGAIDAISQKETLADSVLGSWPCPPIMSAIRGAAAISGVLGMRVETLGSSVSPLVFYLVCAHVRVADKERTGLLGADI